MDKAEFKLAAYEQGFQRNLESCNAERTIYYGVKYLGRRPYQFDPLQIENQFGQFSAFLELFRLITPDKLMGMFPITKYYDRTGILKDYYSTMAETVNLNGRYQPIKAPLEFLMDYMNPDTRYFVVRFMGILDDFRQLQGNKGMLETFFGIHPTEQ